MPWRVVRVMDFTSFSASVHAKEEDAKIDVGRHLGALLEQLRVDLPRYATVWGYPKAFPGFVEDAEEVVEVGGSLLATGDVWGAYDVWHEFMNKWDGPLSIPLWAQIGTVVVEGPGPTVHAAWVPDSMRNRFTKPLVAQRPSKIAREEFLEGLAQAVSQTVDLVVEKVAHDIEAGGGRADRVQLQREAMAVMVAFIERLKQPGKPFDVSEILGELAAELGVGLRGRFGLPPPSPRLSGAMVRWKVIHRDFTGRNLTSVHAHEEDAKKDVEEALHRIIRDLQERVERDEPGSRMEVVDDVKALLRTGDTWGAYARWREFEDDVAEAGLTPPWQVTGSVRVEAT